MIQLLPVQGILTHSLFFHQIMAYGQTGSGKTFTMGSEAHTELELTECTGLIPRFMKDLYQQLANDKNYHLETSFLEVYGEDVHDLLDPSRTSLPLREDSSGGVVCIGLKAKAVVSVEQAVQVLHEGTLNRTTAATLMNLTSSRSHAVFTVTLTRHSNNNNITSKLTFVDLAGSERMKKTGAEGERAREGIEINKGLLALGNVINALADEERLQNNTKKIHVPYRQSKLTRLLQDALGGNSQTLFLACVSAADTNVSETLSTLHYANRARNIQNAPTRNVDPTGLEVQQWQAYVAVLQAELIQLKFSSGSSSPTGQVSEELMEQKDVNDYLDKLQLLAQQRLGTNTVALRISAIASPLRQVGTFSSELLPPHDANLSILENFDPALLDEVNPDEDMAILDQLLDLQQQDQDYDREKKKDYDDLKQVEGELAEQEQLLLQLRESLKVYHNMKAKYENLMVEVQQLELEKAQLAEQLEKASADPTLGCSRAIKKEMEMVERNLVRARNETRKHREMYQKAEQEAQKCRAMERKIAELKHGRANLIKKQKEAAARYREMTESKTREIMALKRKGRNTESKMTKLQSDIQVHKRNLDKRQAYCKKLQEQKKQTEKQLMKLLAMRQRDLRERTTRGGRRDTTATSAKLASAVSKQEAFAPADEGIESINVYLYKAVEETVAYAVLKGRYEDQVAEYSEAMRALVSAVNELENAGEGERHELEHAIQELQIKVELFGLALEETRSGIARVEADEGSNDINSIGKVILDKSAPVLRTILIGTIDKLVEAEVRGFRFVHSLVYLLVSYFISFVVQLQRKNLARAIELKENVVKSYEMEVDLLNENVMAFKKELVYRHSVVNGALDPVDIIEKLQSKESAASTKLEESQQEVLLMKLFADDLAKEHEVVNSALAETKEKLAIAEVAISQCDGVNVPKDILLKLQTVWNELGVSTSVREDARVQIKNCLEDTCTRKLEEAEHHMADTEKEILKLRYDLVGMCASLAIDANQTTDSSEDTLLKQLQCLQQRHSRLQPIFLSAVGRRDAIAAQVSDLAFALGVSRESLDSDLLALLSDMTHGGLGTNESGNYGPGKLSEDYLSRCDAAMSALRLRKSKILTDNSKLQSETLSLVSEMNLGDADVVALVVHSLKCRRSSMPSWWNHEMSEMVARFVTTVGGVVRSSKHFSQHLAAFHDSLFRLAQARRQLSTKLRDIVERAQITLLKTVDGQFEANEAYSNFHEALFRLPTLSQERIHACMVEIDALTSGVDAMCQSEIEALTVVWEALNISMATRGKFWGAIDQAVREMESQPHGPFDEVVRLSAVDGEEWVLAAVRDGTKNYRELETRLFKLEKIHEEVEQLRAQQDAKSRIISLDSEVRILSAKLNEFEDKKCNKQRLTTKKSTSSTLLKEERFRKQMQAKFTSELDQLVSLLKAWKANENSAFDQNLLSEDVRMLLKNSDRNEFMHLRTVEYKSTAKHEAGSYQTSDGSSSPPHKRRALSSRPPSARPRRELNARETLSARTSTLSIAESTKKRNNADAFRSPMKAVTTARLLKHTLSPDHDGIDTEREKKKIKSRSPFAQAQPAIVAKPPSDKKRLTLDPFGTVLAQARSPPGTRDKENPATSD